MIETRTLGTSAVQVTRIGLGLAALGRPGYINLGHADDLPDGYAVEEMEAHTHALLDAAYAAGIRYFDTARSYGKGEDFLGTWLQKHAYADISIGSKWGYTYTANWQVEADKHEVKEHSLPVLQRQWGETQANLSQHLDLYQIHSATLSSGALDNRDVLDELARLKADAGIAIGLSLSGVNQAATLEQALTVERDGVRLFDSVQATWNILERSVGTLLATAHSAGIGVIIKEALANGRLTSRNHHPQFVAQRQLLNTQAERLNTSIDGLALAAVLAQEWVDVVLSGVANIDHLNSNLGALTVAWDEEAEAALATLTEDVESYWQTRSNLSWN